jgi:hypothetical protein
MTAPDMAVSLVSVTGDRAEYPVPDSRDIRTAEWIRPAGRPVLCRRFPTLGVGRLP